MEGQTTLVDEMAALVKAAQEHKPQRDAHAPKTDGLVFSVLDQVIESMPDEHEQAELPGGIADASAPRRAIHPIHVTKGWPERYVGELDEPRGGEWQAAFALMLPVISSGGIGLLHGKRGSGKTRMAAEIARTGRFPADQTLARKVSGAPAEPRRTAIYRTAMGFFVDVRATFRKSSEESEKQVLAELKECGLLVIDELQERGETQFEDRLLTHLIDARYNAMRPTILIANLKKEELEITLGPSITDRVAENGRRIEFTWDSYRRKK